MNKLLWMLALVWTLSGCGEKEATTWYVPVPITPEWVKLYDFHIDWIRECTAGEIWRILVVACKGKWNIELQWNIWNLVKECAPFWGQARLCAYEGSLEDLSKEYTLTQQKNSSRENINPNSEDWWRWWQ